MRGFAGLFVVGTALAVGFAGGLGGCAATEIQEFPDDNGGTNGPAQGTGGVMGTGGDGGAITSGAGGDGGDGGDRTGLCDIDCSTIQAPDCHVAVCNEGMHPGPVGSCVVVPGDDGGSCEDGLFCTVADTCIAGVCEAGVQNTCGITPGQCDEVICNEQAMDCSLSPLGNGASCESSDLCIVGSTCTNGICGGGVLNDCFFAPVPDECHEAICNSQTGMCDPMPGNDGDPCTDQMDLCTVGKTCSGGMCLGGGPKNCSHLTGGCNIGMCDNATGMCFADPVMNGGLCDDLNSCTAGETCQNGVCAGGTPITQCIAGDSCCPMGCTEATDADCSCAVNIALNAVASSSGGGSNSTGFGPDNWNDGVDSAGCTMAGCNQCQGWVSNSTSPGGAYMQYTWPSPVTIGSMYIDTEDCASPGCNNGRPVHGAEVQWWNGSSWITAQTFSNAGGDTAMTFNPAINTTQLRLFNVVAGGCGQMSNSLMYEWFVWPGANCMPQ